MNISDEDYCLEVNNITKTKTENKTIRICYLVDTGGASTINYFFCFFAKRVALSINS